MEGNVLGGIFTRTPQPEGGIRGAVRGFGNFLQDIGNAGLRQPFRREEQEQQLDEQRKKAMAQDAFTVYGLLNDNKVDDALSLIDRRVQYINELGGDPSDTLQLRDMIASGQTDIARQELGSFVTAAMENGYLAAPAQPEIVKGSEIVDGQVVQRMPDGSFRAIRPEGFEATPKESPDPARERQIADLMETFSMTRQDAIRAMMEKTFVDPTSGNIVNYDPLTRRGTMPELDIPGQSSTALPPERRVEMDDLAFDPGKGTGFASAFLGAWNSTIGQLPFVPISTERAQAAQNLRILERDAINALATSSRPAVVEQQRIIQALPQAMEWFENPDDARMKMTSFVDLMTNQYVDDLRYSSNMRNPRTLREESLRRASEVERIMNRVLTPDAAQEMMRSINRVESSRQGIMTLSDDDILNLDPSQMSDTELDLLEERLRGRP
jgi:hypothetical protein